MLKKTIEKAFNKQINAEIYSAYLYLSMAAYFESIGLKGFAHWMRIQEMEEKIHAMKFFNYVNATNGRVTLTQIAGPETEWASPLAAFEAVLAHEIKVTGLIHGLVDLAIKEKDHASNNFLQWFVTEQVEEEESAGEIVSKLKLIGKDTSALFMLDGELAARPVPPDPTLGAATGGAKAGA